MKNRKLFVILTLIAFMMSLAPMAAFAVVGAPDRNYSELDIDTQSADADNLSTVGVKVYLYDERYTAVGGTVYMATSRGAESGLTVDTPHVMIGTGDRAAYAIDVPASGTITVKMRSNRSGNFYVAFGLDGTAAAQGDLYDFASGTVSAATAGAIGSRQQLTFSAPTAGRLLITGVTKDNGSSVPISVAASDTANLWTVTGDDAKANGLDQYEFTFRLVTGGDTPAPVSGTEVRFSTSSSYLVTNKTSGNTSSVGNILVKVAATRAGKYTLTGTQGARTARVEVDFGSATVDTIKLVDDDNQLVARNSEFSFKFRLYDSNGASIDYTGTAPNPRELYADENYKIRLDATKRPSGTKLEEKLYEKNYVAVEADDGDLKVTLAENYVDREGDYQIRAALPNGKSAYINYKVQEQGVIVGITLSYEETGVPLEGVTGGPSVKRVDAAGVTRKINLANNEIKFSINNAARGTIGTYSGVFRATDDSANAGAVTITAVDTTNNAVATYELAVSQLTSLVKLTPPSVTPVGGDAVVVAQLVDANGSPVSLGAVDGDTNVDFRAYAISSPEGGVVNVVEEGGATTKFRESGKSTVTVSSSAAGTVRIQVVVSAKVNVWSSVWNDTTQGYVSRWVAEDRTYTGSADVVFSTSGAGGTAGTLTMIVGSNVYVADNVAKQTDTPPFIQDGRAYVAIRPVAEAFGASVDWDKATQTATLSTGSVVVEVTVGSPTLKITESGVTREYASDASAQIIGEGRVVLPFRAVGEAFGYTVEYNADTQTVVYKAPGK